MERRFPSRLVPEGRAPLGSAPPNRWAVGAFFGVHCPVAVDSTQKVLAVVPVNSTNARTTLIPVVENARSLMSATTANLQDVSEDLRQHTVSDIDPLLLLDELVSISHFVKVCVCHVRPRLDRRLPVLDRQDAGRRAHEVDDVQNTVRIGETSSEGGQTIWHDQI
mgnify:CR=1 FL=1